MHIFSNQWTYVAQRTKFLRCSLVMEIRLLSIILVLQGAFLLFSHRSYTEIANVPIPLGREIVEVGGRKPWLQQELEYLEIRSSCIIRKMPLYSECAVSAGRVRIKSKAGEICGRGGSSTANPHLVARVFLSFLVRNSFIPLRILIVW